MDLGCNVLVPDVEVAQFLLKIPLLACLADVSASAGALQAEFVLYHEMLLLPIVVDLGYVVVLVEHRWGHVGVDCVYSEFVLAWVKPCH